MAGGGGWGCLGGRGVLSVYVGLREFGCGGEGEPGGGGGVVTFYCGCQEFDVFTCYVCLLT